MLSYADIVVDLQAGDTGKGKVSHHLANINDYDAVVRFNGGGNAGHTIYHNGEKIVTHQVPAGIFYNVPSIIGPGCVVDIEKLKKEIAMLREHGFMGEVLIDQRTHVTTSSHVEEDNKDTKLGTTGQGIGPTYRDKYFRVGKRIADVVNPYQTQDFKIIDIYDYFYNINNANSMNILCEGAQGFQLDIDWGDYPYVTSSSCTSAAVAMNGIAPRYWRNVYGVIKAYETYSGFKTHFVDTKQKETFGNVFKQIQQVGNEFGATTGRERQVRWIHLDGVIQALYINNITNLIINKVDVLDEVGSWAAIYKNETYTFKNSKTFRNFVEETINWEYHHKLNEIVWSTKMEGL